MGSRRGNREPHTYVHTYRSVLLWGTFGLLSSFRSPLHIYVHVRMYTYGVNSMQKIHVYLDIIGGSIRVYDTDNAWSICGLVTKSSARIVMFMYTTTYSVEYMYIPANYLRLRWMG